MSLIPVECATTSEDAKIMVLMEALFAIVATYHIAGGDMETMMYAIESFVVGAVSECDLDVAKKRAMATRIRDVIHERVRLNS